MCVGHLQEITLIFAKDVLHFADLGFKQISIEPVVGEDSDFYSIKKGGPSKDL